MLRLRGPELTYSKIDSEVLWFDSRKNSYTNNTSLEDLLSKSKEEDVKYQTDTLPVIYLSLAHISLGEVKTVKSEHVKIYNNLKSEADNLVKLGRADAGLLTDGLKILIKN